MEEMLSYVFGTIRSNDASIRTIKRGMKQQSKINVRVAFLICSLAYTMLKNKKKQDAKMEVLANEIDKMKEEQKSGKREEGE